MIKEAETILKKFPNFKEWDLQFEYEFILFDTIPLIVPNLKYD